MKNRIFYGLVAILLVIGCTPRALNSEGFARPSANHTFSYQSRVKQITSNEIIDTTVIYYLKESYVERTNKNYKNPSWYIRFYADGRFKKQIIKALPTVEEINNINKGSVGYYRIVGHVIKLQHYSESMYGGPNYMEYGLIDAKGNLDMLSQNPVPIFFINTGLTENGMRRKLSKSPFGRMLYVKTKIPGMDYQTPNW